MAVKIDFSSNIKTFSKRLPDALKKQVPFATSLALNETARLVAKSQRSQASKYFDRPTPFLLNGIVRGNSWAGIRSDKRVKRFTATLIPGFIGGRGFGQAGKRVNQVLLRQTEGGKRTPDKRAIVVPTRKARLNRYGNMTQNQVKNLLNQKNVVSLGPRDGVKNPGIYRRGRGGRLTMLVAYEPSTQYRPLYPYYRIADGVAKSQFGRVYARSFARAVSGMRIR